MRDGCVVKGVRFREHRIVGDILELAQRYVDGNADELVFYDITASPDGRSVDRRWVSEVAALLDIPFCVAGGIRSLSDAGEVLERGADKISVNTPALNNPDLVDDLVRRFGSQCIVIGIDSCQEGGRYRVYSHTGDVEKTTGTGRETADWVDEVQARGAGEIVLNCMNQDGVRDGYDISQLATIRRRCYVPLIASGGAGRLCHFKDVFEQARVDGALAASVFHSGELTPREVQHYLAGHNINVRR